MSNPRISAPVNFGNAVVEKRIDSDSAEVNHSEKLPNGDTYDATEHSYANWKDVLPASAQ